MIYLLSFVIWLIRNAKFVTTLCATGVQNTATIGGRHSFTEPVLVFSFSVRRLKCSFHI